MDSKELALTAAKILDSKKAQDIRVLRVMDQTILTDYFVIAGGTSNTHVKALAEEVEFQLQQQLEIHPLRTEGYDTRTWVALDYGSVIVHVFCPEAREYYNLERLWADAEPIELDLGEN